MTANAKSFMSLNKHRHSGLCFECIKYFKAKNQWILQTKLSECNANKQNIIGSLHAQRIKMNVWLRNVTKRQRNWAKSEEFNGFKHRNYTNLETNYAELIRKYECQSNELKSKMAKIKNTHNEREELFTKAKR